MLKELRIFNLILIESSAVTFQSGLNVMTGETGSGKSAILHALRFIAGARADSNLIRKGCPRGCAEAAFDITHLPFIHLKLEASGIIHTSEEDLIIRREIAPGGKSRAFVNNQMVPIAFVKELGEELLGILGQHANQNLLSTNYQRHLLDLYAGLTKEADDFQTIWERENKLKSQLNRVTLGEAKRLRSIETYMREIQELEDAALKEGEEEELFAEYTVLNNRNEIASKAGSILYHLHGNEKSSLLSVLRRLQTTAQELIALDSNLQECAGSFASALLELQEVAHLLGNYQHRLEADPERLQIIDERLRFISTLKRRYGNTFTEIETYRKEAVAKLLELQGVDDQLALLTEELEKCQQDCQRLAEKLTIGRKSAAEKLELTIAEELRSLNMPRVNFQVCVDIQKRDGHGDDAIEFFLHPNVGEHQISLKACASGGELSRVLLALHTVLAGREATPTLIFDEIDANIGGETAAVIGEKLKEISKQQQVICITHFPQVARQACLHLQISKAEKAGRTLTEIQVLDGKGRRLELARMLGGDLSFMPYQSQ